MAARGGVALHQPQRFRFFGLFCVFHLLRLVFDTAAPHY
jgi:hypothetical protein